MSRPSPTAITDSVVMTRHTVTIQLSVHFKSINSVLLQQWNHWIPNSQFKVNRNVVSRIARSTQHAFINHRHRCCSVLFSPFLRLRLHSEYISDSVSVCISFWIVLQKSENSINIATRVKCIRFRYIHRFVGTYETTRRKVNSHICLDWENPRRRETCNDVNGINLREMNTL